MKLQPLETKCDIHNTYDVSIIHYDRYYVMHTIAQFLFLHHYANSTLVILILQLMEGRKAVGGKLEIKLRLRNPILTKQMELLEERWLLLDS